jgi:O-antigen/teichoic acid export membrane protein
MIARLVQSDVARHGAIVFAGVVLASIFNYLYYMLIGRHASIETYGIVTSLASALLVLAAPANVAQIIAARLAADLAARGDLAALRRLGDIVTIWSTGIVSVVVVAGVLLRDVIARFFNLSDSGPIVIALISFALVSVVIVQRGVFQGSQRFGEFAASSSIDATIKVAVGVPLVGPFGASGGLFGLVIGLAFAALYNVIAFGRSFGAARAPIALDPGLITRVVSNVGLSQFTFTVLSFYDVPLIKHVFDSRSAGLYAAAALVGRAVIAATSFVPTLIMPKATARAARGQSPLPLLGVALGLAAVVAGIAALIALVAPRFLVTIIGGPRFGNAAPIVFTYVVASGALSLANVSAAYKIGLHQYDFVRPVALVGLGEVVALALWHPTLTAAVTVLVCGHLALFAVTLFRLNAPANVPRSAGGLAIADAD